MFRIARTLVFFILISGSAAANAQSGAYTVRDVKVDIVAESSVKARNQAFTAAQTKAFKMLAARFMNPEEVVTQPMPSSETIAGMVADFEITSEQLSKKRYLGTYVFRFKAGPVNRYFGHGPVASYEEIAADRQLLIIPIFSQNGQGAMWDLKKNPWLQAWQNQPADSMAGLIVPPGNVSDVMDIRQLDAASITSSGLKRIKARYNAKDIVIASAVFDQKAKDVLKIDLYRTDYGKPELVQSLPVPFGKATKLGELLKNAVPEIKTVLAGNWKNEAEVAEDPYALTSETIADAAAAPVVAPEPYSPQSGIVKATARFSSMSEWLSMRRSLNGIPPLLAIRILALTTNQVSMQLSYSDWMALTSALAARGLSLQSTGPGEYNLIRIMNTTGYPQ